MVEAKLLEQRRLTKSKKPTFLRQDANRNKSLVKNWRKPKGMHSKMRLHLRGRRASPSPGYSSPRAVRGLTREGLQEVHVYNVKDLQDFNPKTQIIVFGNIGLRNKMGLLKMCIEKKYVVAQIKDIPAFMKKVESDLAARKTKKKQSEEKKTKTKEDVSKKAKDVKQEKKEESTSEVQEETKKGEKSEKIKVLEKKQ